jgi:hypothetical protein
MGFLRPTAALVAAALITTPVVSVAQPKPPTDSQKAQVSELVKKAITKSQTGDHTSAIDLYQQAYIIVPVPVLLSNIATEYQAAGKQVEALDYFCKYLDADPAGNNVTYALAKAKSLAIELRHTNDVDDKNVCHPPEPDKTPTNTGTTTPETGAGSGSAETTGTEAVKHDQTPAVESKGDSGGALRISGFAVAGVGLVVAAVGGYYIFKSKQLNDDEQNHCPPAPATCSPWPATLDGVKLGDLQSTGDMYNTRAYEFSIAGGAVVVLGGVLLYLGYNRKGSPAEHASITPIVTTSSAGLALSGGF